MDKVAVLIPCYNEELSIKQVIDDCKKYIKNCTIYVYDNNSTDNTVSIAKENGAIVRHEYLQGKGNVIRRMFREIDAMCYLMIDGDNTYSLDKANEMIDLVLNNNVDMVVGDRLSSTYFKENKRPFHNFGNSLVRKLINMIFKSNVKDIMTGFRAFSYQFVKTFPVLTKKFEIETEMTIHAIDKNMLIKNVIIEYRDRQKGSKSKLNTYSDGFKVMKTIFRLFRVYKPLSFFSLIFIILTIISTCFFVPILIEFIKTHQVAKFPTLIVCCFTYVASLQSLFTGIILNTIRHSSKQQFEQLLIQTNDSLKQKINNEKINSTNN